jgi:hypothetical protein
MRAQQHTGKIVFLLIALAVCVTSLPRQLVHADSSAGQERLVRAQVMRPDVVLVWLGDVADRFEQARVSLCTNRCESGTQTLAVPDESTLETADTCGNNQSDQIIAAVCPGPQGSAVLVPHHNPASPMPGAGRSRSERSPPPSQI